MIPAYELTHLVITLERNIPDQLTRLIHKSLAGSGVA
jgi:hypothetical protein